jgi:hypothetical protein
VIEKINGQWVLNERSSSKEGKDKPDTQRDHRGDQSCDKDTPKEVDKIDAFCFGNHVPVIAQCTQNKEREEYLRDDLDVGFLYFIPLEQDKVDIKEAEEQP